MLNIRKGIDGSFWIPRQDQETEAWLDSQYVRLPNQLRWVDKIPNVLNFFHNIHANKACYIIGKGESLDYIHKVKFDAVHPIICLNESIHAIEELELPNTTLVTQLDSTLGETCRPKKATILLAPRCANLYSDLPNRFVVDPRSFGLDENCLSILYAISLARYMGCTVLKMVSFDGCMNGSIHYGKKIGYPSTRGGSPLRFKEHRPLINEATKNIAVEWLLPHNGGVKTEQKISGN
jgi:hypothetical protein